MDALIAEKRLEEGRLPPPLRRRSARRALGTLLTVAGVILLAWAVTVWRWQDPLTALYTRLQQDRLAAAYDRRAAGYHEPAGEIRNVAAAYRRSLDVGDPVGRLRIPRVAVDMVVVQGTDDTTLRKGPGHYVPSALPGERRLVYVAGHRTTFLAPFSHIDRIRAGDVIAFELPYGTFRYRVTRHFVVAADDTRVLRGPRRELLRLQACHPRLFSTHRYIVDARLVGVDMRGSG